MLLCVAAAPANAPAVPAEADQPVKPTVSAEQAMAAYRSGYTIAKRRCGEDVGGAIVVALVGSDTPPSKWIRSAIYNWYTIVFCILL